MLVYHRVMDSINPMSEWENKPLRTYNRLRLSQCIRGNSLNDVFHDHDDDDDDDDHDDDDDDGGFETDNRLLILIEKRKVTALMITIMLGFLTQSRKSRAF